MSKHCAIDVATKIDAVESGTRSKADIAKSFSTPTSILGKKYVM